MKHKVSLSDIGAYILLAVIAGVIYFGWDPLPAGGPPAKTISSR